MMIYGKNNEKIEIPFPETKYQEYLTLLGNKSSADLTFQEQKKLFITAIADFLCGKLGIDELAAIAGYEWNKLVTRREEQTDLGEALYAANELAYYSRHIHDTTTDMFNDFMNTVMDYYHKLSFIKLR